MDSEASAGTAEKMGTGHEIADNLERTEKAKEGRWRKPVPLQHSTTKEKAKEAERKDMVDTAQHTEKGKEKDFKGNAGCATR